MKSIQSKILNTNIYIGKTIVDNILQKIFKKQKIENCFLVCDRNIYKHYQVWLAGWIKKNKILILPAGEKTKSITYLQKIYTFLLKQKAHRKSLLIAFGGGMIGDIVGFAAASFLRGILLIQIPTSLLAQIDSGLGGKTGINHPLAKNSIGSLYQPFCSIMDIHFLKSLPKREFISGYAEVLKAAFIQDRKFFHQLDKIQSIQNIHNKELIKIIETSALIKLKVVEKDEKESLFRAILNFGHTLAHWIENHTQYQTYLHGEAVFGGMDFALWWSKKYCGLSLEEYQMARQHLLKFATKILLPPVTKKVFCATISRDKKVTNNGIRFIGIKEIGKALIIEKVQIEQLWQDFLAYLQDFQSIIKIKK